MTITTDINNEKEIEEHSFCTKKPSTYLTFTTFLSTFKAIGGRVR